jgi:hypothetical protein
MRRDGRVEFPHLKDLLQNLLVLLGKVKFLEEPTGALVLSETAAYVVDAGSELEARWKF